MSLAAITCLAGILAGIYLLVRNYWTYNTLVEYVDSVMHFETRTGMTTRQVYHYVLIHRFWVWDIDKLLDYEAYNFKHKSRDLP